MELQDGPSPPSFLGPLSGRGPIPSPHSSCHLSLLCSASCNLSPPVGSHYRESASCPSLLLNTLLVLTAPCWPGCVSQWWDFSSMKKALGLMLSSPSQGRKNPPPSPLPTQCTVCSPLHSPPSSLGCIFPKTLCWRALYEHPLHLPTLRCLAGLSDAQY